jgi:hypothetical protein
MGQRRLSQSARVVLIAVAIILLVLLAAKCAYNAGEWIGGH